MKYQVFNVGRGGDRTDLDVIDAADADAALRDARDTYKEKKGSIHVESVKKPAVASAKGKTKK